jgi:hypothetical protein
VSCLDARSSASAEEGGALVCLGCGNPYDRAMAPANDGLRFLLELGTLAAVAYGGWSAGDGWWRWLLALAAPLAVAVVWGRFMAPKSAMRVADPTRLVLEVLIFGSAVVALAATSHPIWAGVFAGLTALHLALTFVLHQRAVA